MRPPKPSPSNRPRSRRDSGKLQTFRQLPYHIALSKAARLEAWTQDVYSFAGPSEAMDSSDFDPRLMERYEEEEE
ncbi:hypothetical protein [Leptothoe kymatousa]|uniref:Uncharacterized protein n=1 Tax=Leptothoe kymatousa TAU-MAC 1615 TaxID=2364775 RepID=A0ABS5Y625_9CYAN|nr:hypothetical protein [Leptothoe kymatousa]MBT9313267.1 hypothetical protein [Leptothoe kymatousa TAU-MAC 1615]